MNKMKKKKQVHGYKEQTNGYQWGEGREEGQDRSRRKRLIVGLYKIRYVKYLAIVNTTEFKEFFIKQNNIFSFKYGRILK